MGLFEWLKNMGAQPEIVHIPDSPHTLQVRRRYRFSGLVQGVGFRWQAKTLAAQLGLTGWARNEHDGTVTVELQGGEALVEEFLRAIRAVPRLDITDIQAERLPLSEKEAAFTLRY